VISKLKGGLDLANAAMVKDSVIASLSRLQLRSLWGLMLHDEEALAGWTGALGQGMKAAKAEGLVRHLGVSVYSVERAEQALQLDSIDIIQVPTNVFDRRLTRVDYFRRAAGLGKTVFVRSIYLQGLALLQDPTAAGAIPHAAAAIATLQQHCAELGVTVQKFAIDFVRRVAGAAARIVIGAESVDQTLENCGLFAGKPLEATALEAWNKKWPQDYPELVDPRLWPARRA
jgi:aryl-alcohol dehydrogenase-like predicted oxidoreductase